MHYISCNSALIALFLAQKGIFLPKDLQKVRKSQQILIRDKKCMFWLKIFVQVQTFQRGPPVPLHNFSHPAWRTITYEPEQLSDYYNHLKTFIHYHQEKIKGPKGFIEFEGWPWACVIIYLKASNIWTKYASLNIEEEFAVNLAIVMRWKFALPLFSNSHFLLASASALLREWKGGTE